MPRGSRLDAPGLVHHIICRGIERRAIFRSDDDRINLIGRLEKLAGGEGMQIYAFALLSNHIHLLTRTLKMPLATFMRKLLTGHSVYFNRRYERTGHLFQNRYKSFVVEEESYLVELVRYVHLNPLRAGIVPSLDALAIWPFCGYSALMGKVKRHWLEVEETLSYFSPTENAARQRLMEFMQDGLAMGRRTELGGGGLKRSIALGAANPKERVAYDERILGSGQFVEALLARLKQQAAQPKSQLDADRLLERVAKYFTVTVPELSSGSKRPVVTKARATAIWLGTRELALPAKVLADALGVKATAVYASIAARRGERESQSIDL